MPSGSEPVVPESRVVGSAEASNGGFTSSCRNPRFCSVVETLASPVIILQRLDASAKKPVAVGFLR